MRQIPAPSPAISETMASDIESAQRVLGDVSGVGIVPAPVPLLVGGAGALRRIALSNAVAAE